MYDILMIGPLTKDIVKTVSFEKQMPGGTPYYFTNAIKNLPVSYGLFTKVNPEDSYLIDHLKGVNVIVKDSKHTCFFENIYPDQSDFRIQRARSAMDPVAVEELADLEAKVFHLGPLLNTDISLEVIKYLSTKGKVSIDAQGLLRTVVNEEVVARQWQYREEGLQYIDIIKLNEYEALTLTGCKNIKDSALKIAKYGVDEVVITLGGDGSLIYYNETFYNIPAYQPKEVVDATGCGDSYMSGYLYKRLQDATVVDSGKFGAAMGTLKVMTSGALDFDEDMLNSFIKKYEQLA